MSGPDSIAKMSSLMPNRLHERTRCAGPHSPVQASGYSQVHTRIPVPANVQQVWSPADPNGESTESEADHWLEERRVVAAVGHVQSNQPEIQSESNRESFHRAQRS